MDVGAAGVFSGGSALLSCPVIKQLSCCLRPCPPALCSFARSGKGSWLGRGSPESSADPSSVGVDTLVFGAGYCKPVISEVAAAARSSGSVQRGRFCPTELLTEPSPPSVPRVSCDALWLDLALISAAAACGGEPGWRSEAARDYPPQIFSFRIICHTALGDFCLVGGFFFLLYLYVSMFSLATDLHGNRLKVSRPPQGPMLIC